MKKLAFTVSFNTPAFLGNAEQQAQWRTPPFKALLRHWWRIVKAPEFNYDHKALLKAENDLFGAATDNNASKSLIRIRLDDWSKGKLTNWPQGNRRVFHPEVGKNGMKIGVDLYLGYGPLKYSRGSTTFGESTNDVKNTAIKPKEETAQLKIGIPEENIDEITSSIHLMNWFGTLGARSRNGWGSLTMENKDHSIDLSVEMLSKYSRSLSECLKKDFDWPHAIGKDDRGLLIWRTKQHDKWQDVLAELADLKIKFRTIISIKNNWDSKKPVFDDRHLLSYPITNHGFEGWCEKDMHGKLKKTNKEKLIQKVRLANQIRFKVIKQNNLYIGQIVHIPCSLPKPLLDKVKNIPDQIDTWQQVHRKIDELLPNGRLK